MFTMQNALVEGWTNQDKFWEGYEDGRTLRRFKEYDNVDGQAYDRGYEVGLHEDRQPLAKPRYEHWGDDPNIGALVGVD